MNKRQKGVAIVEFALILPFLLLLTFITTEFGRAIWQYNTLTKSVRDSARYLSIQTPGDPVAIAKARNLTVYGNLAGTGTPLAHRAQPSNVPDPDLADRRLQPRDQHRHRPDHRLHLQLDVRQRVRPALRRHYVLRHHRHHEELSMRPALKSRQCGRDGGRVRAGAADFSDVPAGRSPTSAGCSSPGMRPPRRPARARGTRSCVTTRTTRPRCWPGCRRCCRRSATSTWSGRTTDGNTSCDTCDVRRCHGDDRRPELPVDLANRRGGCGPFAHPHADLLDLPDPGNHGARPQQLCRRQHLLITLGTLQ